MPSSKVKHLQIPLQEILLATNEFAYGNLIANGGFGKIYIGISKKYGYIAIKRLDRKLGQGDHEFKIEIDLLSVYKHEKLVSLLGFCDEDCEKILVYKYETGGSLDRHLYNQNFCWFQRLQICIDAAHGLKYLHDDVGPQHRIIHRDVKSSNILLGEGLKAKISDFGLSRVGPANMQHTFIITKGCGTPGYIDPDYFISGYLTQKSDVYSFGIVLWEVLCGRLACVPSNSEYRQSLSILVREHYIKKTLDRIIPSYLCKQIKTDSLHTFSKIAYQCLENVEKRPTMKQVAEQLQKAMDNQPAGYCCEYNDAHRRRHQRIKVRGRITQICLNEFKRSIETYFESIVQVDFIQLIRFYVRAYVRAEGRILFVILVLQFFVAILIDILF